MKKYLLILITIILCLLYAAAGADPAVTDSETTAWIGENNYLFLQGTNGMVAQLSMEISDLIGTTDDEVIGLAGNRQIIAVKKNGTGSRIVEDAETESLKEPRLKQEEDVLLLDGQKISDTAIAAVTDGVYVYIIEHTGISFILRVTPAQSSRQLTSQQSRNANALALSGTTVAEPLNMTVTREALAITDTDHQVTVMNFITGQIFRYPATSSETAAACLQGGILYRYLVTDEGKWILESGMEVSTPTPAPTPSPTPTPKPTQKSTTYYDDDGTIYYGAYGSKVKKIQTRLYELGYPIWQIDGKYGEETQLAINLFCDAIHVREHRYITYKVQKKLFAGNAPVYDPYLPLKKGDQGISVLYMQARLKELGYDPGKIDGIYGKNTVAAVALFQADHGITLAEKEKPGETASREMLELLYSPETVPEPTPTDTVNPTTTPSATQTVTPSATPTMTPTPTPVPATWTDLK